MSKLDVLHLPLSFHADQKKIYEVVEEMSDDERETVIEWRRNLAIVFTMVSCMGALSSLGLMLYITVRGLYRNFVSNHFIAHLMLTNFLACTILLPIYIRDLYTSTTSYGAHNQTIEGSNDFFCRAHAFLSYTMWSVIYYMMACIAGVHLITFARIHYEQLFGLSPNIICGLAWLAGAALSLPSLTNGSIVTYNPRFRSCIFQENDVAYRFLAYILLLGVVLPVMLTMYAYIRVLAIFYHSPLIYKHLGLFKSRFVIFALIALQWVQMPFYMTYFLGIRLVDIVNPHITYPICLFFGYSICTCGSYLYALTMFLMKEDDIALTHRTHATGGGPMGHHHGRQGNKYAAPGIEVPQAI